MSRLESVLLSLPESVDWPEPSPHLAARVTARIEAAPSRARRRWVWATAVSAVALAVALVPGARQAVADLIVEAGVRIGVIEEAPAVGVDLELGEVVTFDEASDAAGFPMRVPRALGLPSAVFLEGDLVSMTWIGTESLPAAPGTDVAVLLTQGAAGEPRAAKGISSDTTLVAVTLDGEPALWIEGAPHAFTILDEDGEPVEETTRLAANVLLWSADGVDYRLELTGDLDRALWIADSLEVREP